MTVHLPSPSEEPCLQRPRTKKLLSSHSHVPPVPLPLFCTLTHQIALSHGEALFSLNFGMVRLKRMVTHQLLPLDGVAEQPQREARLAPAQEGEPPEAGGGRPVPPDADASEQRRGEGVL